jgi:hypothetical protein
VSVIEYRSSSRTSFLGDLDGICSDRPRSAGGIEIMREEVHYNILWRTSHLEPACSLKVFHYIKKEKEKEKEKFQILLLYNHITTLQQRNQLLP